MTVCTCTANTPQKDSKQTGLSTNPCTAPDTTSAVLERYRPTRVIFFADWAALINFHFEGLNPQKEWEVDTMTNVFVPWTSAAQFSAHEAQALPQIEQFADDLVERILARKRDRGTA
jgi:hypothetical protein